MAYVTRSEAVQAALGRRITLDRAAAELRKSAAAAFTSTFDVFLSHSYEDAIVVAGIKALLESDGLSVYVEWHPDPQLDRNAVTAKNALVLRGRLSHCRFLLYAASKASSDSRWMPWELGYFDGRRGEQRVAILPIVATASDGFVGLEYLGLVPEDREDRVPRPQN